MAPTMIWERKKEKKKDVSMEAAVGGYSQQTIPRKGMFLLSDPLLMIDAILTILVIVVQYFPTFRCD